MQWPYVGRGKMLLTRTNSNKSAIIERYTPTTKYAGVNPFFYSPPPRENNLFPMRSNSTSSSARLDYKVRSVKLSGDFPRLSSLSPP